MEDRETPRMHKYGERKTTRIMMAAVRHVTSSSGLRKFQTDGFLLDGVYIKYSVCVMQLLQKEQTQTGSVICFVVSCLKFIFILETNTFFN